MRVRRTRHFIQEQLNDGITDEEIARAWTEAELDRPSQDHRGARVRTATQPDGSKVTVLAMQSTDVLEFITTWRS